MSHAKVLELSSPQLDKYFDLLRRLEKCFRSAGLPASQTSLLAMHLAEIAEECGRYEEILAALLDRETANSNGEGNELLDQLVELQIALDHLRSHVRAVTPLLNKGIDILDRADPD